MFMAQFKVILKVNPKRSAVINLIANLIYHHANKAGRC